MTGVWLEFIFKVYSFVHLVLATYPASAKRRAMNRKPFELI
jgi:hypothetical protein